MTPYMESGPRGGMRALGLAAVWGLILGACAPGGGVWDRQRGSPGTPSVPPGSQPLPLGSTLLQQPTFIPGNYAVTPQPLPDPAWVIARAYPGYPVYGLYTYFWSYKKFRQDVGDVGWKFFRMGGPADRRRHAHADGRRRGSLLSRGRRDSGDRVSVRRGLPECGGTANRDRAPAIRTRGNVLLALPGARLQAHQVRTRLERAQLLLSDPRNDDHACDPATEGPALRTTAPAHIRGDPHQLALRDDPRIRHRASDSQQHRFHRVWSTRTTRRCTTRTTSWRRTRAWIPSPRKRTTSTPGAATPSPGTRT